MIRFVADTNVIVSATIVQDGASNQVLQAWRRGKVELATSPMLIKELEEVLLRPRIQKYQRMAQQEILELLALLKQAGIQAPGKQHVNVIVEDPDDNLVLGAALETYADYVVSGDRHLLDLGEYQGIKIVSPVEFLKVLQKLA